MERLNFSVIIPLFNKEEYIQRAVTSVLNQSYKKFELIIVNDASTDNSVKVVEKNFDDPRLRLIHRKENSGSVGPPRNTGIQEAKHRYVAFLDADDEWAENFLEDTKKSFESENGIDAVSFSRILKKGGVEELGHYLRLKGENFKSHILELDDFFKARINSANPYRIQAMAFKKEIFNDVGGFVGKPRSSDVEFMVRFHLFGKRCLRLPQVGTIIHRVPNSVVKKTPDEYVRPYYYPILEEIHRRRKSGDDFELGIDFIVTAHCGDIKKIMKKGELGRKHLLGFFFFRYFFFYCTVYCFVFFPGFLQKRMTGLLKTIFYCYKIIYQDTYLPRSRPKYEKLISKVFR